MREFRADAKHLGRKAPDGRALEAVTLGFELKQLSEDGTGAGFLSVMGNEDSYGDVVEAGAFTKTLSERSADNPVPFLWQHDSAQPIGVYTEIREVSAKFAGEPANAALYTEFKYALDVQQAREAYALAKMRACKGQSIGYTTIKDDYDRQTGLRYLKELRLWEGSQVTFPANELATIHGVKSADQIAVEIERLSAELRALRASTDADPSDERAALKALVADLKSGIAALTGEPAPSTRTPAATLAAEIESFLTHR